MASPAYEQILEVQALDLNLTQLRHRLVTHPLRQQVAAAQKAVHDVQEVSGEIEDRRHQLDRNLKKLSDEVETIEAKRTQVDGKLYDGSVTGTKELLALQDEAAGLLDRQRGLEDQELEIMEQLELIDAELASARAELETAEAASRNVDDELRAAAAEIEAEIEAVEQERARTAAPAVPELLARYEALSGQFDGVAVARLVDGRCDGCHMQLSAVAVDQLGKAPEDAVVTCEECGRLLVR
ncbi:MAG: C4-type zinc ribbon domain-containing protein [Acidimicrobiia bacterium]|nr:C4-type zinc ribbon domain-containing protein [Acidimicrobiia bacterium]